jgi:hypothetical protein
MPPRRHGRIRPERLSRRKGGDDRRHPANEKIKNEHQPLEIKGAQAKYCSPQNGEAPASSSSRVRGLCGPWRRGRGIPPLRRSSPPSLSSSSSSSSDEFVGVAGGEPLLLAQMVLLTLLLPSAARSSSPSRVSPAPVPPLRGMGSRPGPGCRRIRSGGIHGHPLLIMTIKNTSVRCKKTEREEKPTHYRGVGEHDERPEVVIAVWHGSEVDRAPRPRRHILSRKTVTQ